MRIKMIEVDQSIGNQIISKPDDNNQVSIINSKLLFLLTKIIQNKGVFDQFVFEASNCILTDSNSINQRYENLCEMIHSTISLIQFVQDIVINDRLANWKREQALAGYNGVFSLNVLDQIQKWFEALADVIINTLILIERIASDPNLANFNDDINMANCNSISILLQQLIVSSIVVEEQPPQVLQTNIK